MSRNQTAFLLLLLISVISCQKEQAEADTIGGKLSINIGLFINVNEVENKLKSTFGTEDFKVTIMNSGGAPVNVFEDASEIPPEIELAPGQYYITAHSDNNLPAAFENPYYYGESEVFTINPGEQQTIGVNCELANSMVSIVYADNIKSNYSDYSTQVSSSAGTLTFTKNEIRAGYFRPLPLTITALLTWQKDDGSMESRTLTGSIPVPQPKKHYEIHISASAAGGSANLQISLDETTGPIEIVVITDETTVPGKFMSGDLLITEIMYNPTELSDATGEWFEIYNNTDLSVDLDQLVIRRNNDRHVINGEIILAPHNYFVLARTNEATTGNKYVYGTSFDLTNSSAEPIILSLNNYGTDGNNGSPICAINYNNEGFPSGTGASICLSPQSLNFEDAVLGDSWCVSTSAYSTGDLGTPGLLNDNCPE